MVIIIRKGESVSVIKTEIQDMKSTKSFDSKKHIGVIELGDTTLSIQKRLRGEWGN